MPYIRNRVLTAIVALYVLLFFFSAVLPSAVFAQAAPAKQEDAPAQKKESPPGSTESKPAKEAVSHPGGTAETPVPISTDKIDEAGEQIGKQIDKAGRGASATLGRWITAKAFNGITWLKLFVCFGLLMLVTAFDRTVRYLIAVRLAKLAAVQELRWGGLLLNAVSKPLSLFIRVYGIYWALSPVLAHFDTPAGYDIVHRVAGKAADLGGTFALFWVAYRCIHVVDSQFRRWALASANSVNDMLVPLVGKTLRMLIIIVGGMMAVQNLTGLEIGPLVASLGIGGLALALAGKDSIANFLGSLTILLDKPFQVGERIAIDKHEGFVEDVGFRSTRLRTLDGCLVSIPNEKIINSALENIGRRRHIRWRTNLGLTCDTPPERVERAVEIVREILANHEGMREDYPPRVYFNGFNEWSLNISVFAWYHSTNYWDYQAWVQRSCLAIMDRFRKEGIELAYPTQTVYQQDLDKQAEPEALGG